MAEPGIAQQPCSRGASLSLFDVVLAVLLAATSIALVRVGPPDEPGRALTVLDVFGAAIVFVLVLLRRRWPLPVLAVAAGLAVVTTTVAGHPFKGFFAATIIAAYTVATRTSPWRAWLYGGLTALAVYGTGIAAGGGWFDPYVGVVAWIGMATALGIATRIRRAYIQAVEERARRAEQTREEEARRRVAEERVRIARDLHDVVAHHIAVINVHTGLAGQTLRTQPDKAEDSLRQVHQSAQTVLDELSTILSVLRQSDDAGAPTDPVRGMAQLGELLDSVAAAGLRVEHRQAGEARPLPAAVDQAAYRIVQEALTNAHKHGASGTADLRVDYRPDAVVLEIANATNSAGPARSEGTGGHGLTGMRERALAIGGSFTAGPNGSGRFHVHAVLPTGAT